MTEQQAQEIIRLLEAMQTSQQLQIERQGEALALQQKQFALMEKQFERVERINDKAEKIQDRHAQALQKWDKYFYLVVVALLAYVSWLVLFKS